MINTQTGVTNYIKVNQKGLLTNTFGFSFILDFSESIGIEMNILSAQKGYYAKLAFDDWDQQIFNYIELPIMFRYYFSN